MSLFLIYFGTDRVYPNLAHHTIAFGPRYKELLSDIFSKGVLADDFSLYLHAPTRTDPSMAPAGCECFYVLAPVPHLGKGNIDWSSVKGPYANRILEYLERNYLPGLRSHIVTQRVFTPEDFATELNAHLGSAFSLQPTLTQSAYFRIHNQDPRIQGLYFVGAGTHPGAGVPGVINSAKATAKVILEQVENVSEAPLPIKKAYVPA
jgi:phytoene desaturase